MSPRAEVAALARFLRRPRRLAARRTAGTSWAMRAAFFAVVVLVVNVPLAAFILDPVRDWAQLTEDMPASVSGRFLLLAVAFAPLCEELLFRAGLRRPGYTLFVGPTLIALVFGPWRPPALIGSAALAAVMLAVWIAQRHRWQRHPGARFGFLRGFVAHYRWVFWGYCLLFAAAHIGNYHGGGPRSVLVLAMVTPQLLMGAVAGYLRLRDGLRSAVLLHAANNAAAVAMLALIP